MCNRDTSINGTVGGGGGVLSHFSYKTRYVKSMHVRNVLHFNSEKGETSVCRKAEGRRVVFTMHKTVNEFWDQRVLRLPTLCDRNFGTGHLTL
jgi:hypothetical protein